MQAKQQHACKQNKTSYKIKQRLGLDESNDNIKLPKMN